jgi:hypothetical protein
MLFVYCVMRWSLILVGIFLISFSSFVISAEESFTKVDFNIDGCVFEDNGEAISVPAGRCSTGNVDGEYFCDADKNVWVTKEEGYGCSLGLDEYSAGDDFCCASGLFCNETVSGEFVCSAREENCVDQMSESNCEDIGCVWLDVSGECSDSVRDYSCGYYENEGDCLTDEWNLGMQGVGTELCGTAMECNGGEVFSVPDSDCGCAWYDYAPSGSKCQVRLVGAQMFYNPTEAQDRFECSSFYEIGECVDGQQNVTWSSNSSVVSGFDSFSAVPNDCLESLGCNGGMVVRTCGEPIIKLPGFSLFALFLSLGTICLFYYFNRKF